MLVSETFVNSTEGIRFSASEPYEPYTQNIGDLFRDYRRQFGRCISYVYIDTKAGDTIPIGWVFQGKDKYEQSTETYLREVWVTLYDSIDPPTRHCVHHDLRKR